MMKPVLAAIAATLMAAFGVAAAHAAAPAADCPVAATPYSLDSLVIDVLLEPRAKAALFEAFPGAAKAPPMFVGTTTPTFASILTVRGLAGMSGSTKGLDALGKALAAVPITPAAVRARCARYDSTPVTLAAPRRPAILVFDRIIGFRDGPSVEAAEAALKAMAARRGWGITITDKPGAISAANLAHFDAVVWNNISGDVLTLSQRAALKRWIEQGGGFAAFHGSAGDPNTIWDWYVDRLIGARFLMHPRNPQFQEARVIVDDPKAGITRGLGSGWTMTEEWYSFRDNPRAKGAHILARLDETTYHPEREVPDLRMAGGDHPIAWSQCIGNGRSFYSAIGHRPESYSQPQSIALLEQGISWAMGKGDTLCRGGKEVAR